VRPSIARELRHVRLYLTGILDEKSIIVASSASHLGAEFGVDVPTSHRGGGGRGLLTRETYTHGHAPAALRQHGRRNVEEAAAFLLPELRPDMHLLDVGCGPGSITRGFAERLTSGRVVGLDFSRDTLSAARADAAARGLDNLVYQEGSVYDLPFLEGSFDVVYAHQVLQHLQDPSAALHEILRVLRPGGLIAARDVDWGSAVYWPVDAWIDRFIDVLFRTWYRNGGEPRMGRRLRALFNAAGVSGLRITSSVWSYSTPSETVEWGESYAERILTSPMGSRPVEYGYATAEDLQSMADAFRAWAVHPDAFWAFTQVAALGRKPQSEGDRAA
jgi:ubiquinone/menaquinone biosynthesis C-methylase UbiE